MIPKEIFRKDKHAPFFVVGIGKHLTTVDVQGDRLVAKALGIQI